MSLRTWITIALFATARLTAAAGALADGSFQGIPWGASENAIQKKFPGQVVHKQCEQMFQKETESLGFGCDTPTVENYRVANIPFALSFHMSKDARELKKVVLFYETVQSIDFSGWRRNVISIQELLEQKYGKPPAPFFKQENGFAMLSAYWRVGDTMVRLESTRGRSGTQMYSIEYMPISSTEASKL